MKYRLHGLILESDFDFPALPFMPGPERADVIFEVATRPGSLGGHLPDEARTVAMKQSDGRYFVELFDLDSKYVMQFRGDSQFEISRDGSRVTCFIDGEKDDGLLRQYFLGWVFSLIIQLKERGGLHCSAVEIFDEAVAFVGSSGAGKSTMVAALCMAGRKLLTDEVMVYALEDDSIYAQSGYREIRLNPESLLGLKERFDVRGVSQRDDYGKVAISPDSAWGEMQHEALPLRCLYILTGDEPSEKSKVEIRQIDPKDAPRELLRHIFVVPKYHKKFLDLQLRLLCGLASRVPVFWLTHPRDIDELPAVIDALTEHQSRLKYGESVESTDSLSCLAREQLGKSPLSVGF